MILSKYNSEPDGDPYEERKLRERDEDIEFERKRQAYIDSLTEQEFKNEIQNLSIPRTNQVDSLLP